MKHEGWDLSGVTQLELDPKQFEKLEAFETLIRERAIPLGMVATADSGRLRQRHLLDSLRAAAVVLDTDRTAYDLGSGAGLPGVVVAIACPDLRMALVESRRPRAAFLQLVVDRLGLANTTVRNERVETLSEKVDLCFSRAFARVAVAWRAADRLLVPGGRLVYFAGERFDRSELPEDAVSTLVTTSALARSGPLVIMSRQ
ncbi:MAG: 16S rRNA (guanine(527)-N(7))-methyltransferase RsmG [Actinomycetota bacterium]